MRKRTSKLNRAAFAVMAFALLASSNVPPVRAQGDEAARQMKAATPDMALEQLEKKFFEHTYAAEPLSRRLDRVEKMVFGEPRSGSESDRLMQLLSLVPATKPSRVSATTRSAPRRPAPVTEQTNYPSVTALETQLLKASYESEQIRTRLDRLEKQAFGQPSVASDLSLRVGALQKYAREKGLNVDTGKQGPVAKYIPPPPTSAAPDVKVAWLEEQVYGRAVPDRSLFQRVKRLNLTVLPSDFMEYDASVPENINTLVSAVELSQTENINPDGSRRYKPLPADPQPASSVSSSKARLSQSASLLQDAGMPSPLKELGADAARITSNEPEIDEQNESLNGKKKKKKTGFWSALKEAVIESQTDNFGVPRYAYGE